VLVLCTAIQLFSAAQLTSQVHNGVETDNPGLLDAMNSAMDVLAAAGVTLPTVLCAVDGARTATLQPHTFDDVRRSHALRLLTYVPGERLVF
jgi:Ser/Thr protein kinase RdoA (MazF antagonist)